jgi:hypothetical protein
MPTLDIVVEKRSNDFKAYLSDNSAVWDCGKTAAEAVGKLVMSARNLFGIAIVRDEPRKVNRRTGRS